MSIRKYTISRINKEHRTSVDDQITVEEPLEIRLNYHTQHGVYRISQLAVTMRTPGNDAALAKGFLFTENIIQDFDDIEKIETAEENVLIVRLKQQVVFDSAHLNRNFYTTSSCGVCGKASIESIHSDTQYLPWSSKLTINEPVIYGLPNSLRNAQSEFQKTGGIHACALADTSGKIIKFAEDVGRHNAMDKLIGSMDSFPLLHIAILSGRASFELVQKASKAGIPILCVIGAPSSLAIDLAKQQGMTLIGFLKSTGFNIYCGADRIR